MPRGPPPGIHLGRPIAVGTAFVLQLRPARSEQAELPRSIGSGELRTHPAAHPEQGPPRAPRCPSCEGAPVPAVDPCPSSCNVATAWIREPSRWPLTYEPASERVL